ncbi:MAG: Asp-tRNA(Asn)/Glu-tRNA(Gln) amidotransferase subunit GatA [Myxococcales bacterium]|nr:Asp-tRNA(Asn)/Glu-tRNA(Gln) amidotransferase subunit GatA [Myxococcales bacterium]
MSLLREPVDALVDKVKSGAVSAEELTRASLAAIDAGASLGAFLNVSREPALAAAREVDAKRKRGEPLGPLAGIPVAVKDALATIDAPTTAASKILLRKLGSPPDPADGYVSPYDATVVARLRAADAIIVGKTNMDELAMGSSNENSAFYPARNPHDPTRTPGGSSGGSAVAVAAGMAPLAIGSDTGGSIRQPAALTGVVGVKPTYGRVSRFGLFAFASSLDQVGVFSHDVAGSARALEVIAGHDPRDATSSKAPLPSLAETRDLRGLRVGVVRELMQEGVEAGVKSRVEASLRELEKAGATLVEVSLPNARLSVASYYVIATAEASSNLARYDGVRFGLREHERGAPLAALYKKTRGRGFGREVKRRILLGTFVLSAGYYDAYYVRAQRARALIERDFQAAFSIADVVASPTSPTVAFPLGERSDDPLAMYLADVCTLPASLAGLPALNLPCGFAPAGDGPALPVGLQLMAPHGADASLFGVARAVEAVLRA